MAALAADGPVAALLQAARRQSVPASERFTSSACSQSKCHMNCPVVYDCCSLLDQRWRWAICSQLLMLLLCSSTASNFSLHQLLRNLLSNQVTQAHVQHHLAFCNASAAGSVSWSCSKSCTTVCTPCCCHLLAVHLQRAQVCNCVAALPAASIHACPRCRTQEVYQGPGLSYGVRSLPP
jgi:hypothetical protein